MSSRPLRIHHPKSRDADVNQNKGVVWPEAATSTFSTSISNGGIIGGAYYADGQYHPGYWTLDLDPRTKADCMDGGWEQYGFKNQGQCVRLVESGHDSR